MYVSYWSSWNSHVLSDTVIITIWIKMHTSKRNRKLVSQASTFHVMWWYQHSVFSISFWPFKREKKKICKYRKSVWHNWPMISYRVPSLRHWVIGFRIDLLLWSLEQLIRRKFTDPCTTFLKIESFQMMDIKLFVCNRLFNWLVVRIFSSACLLE